MKAIVIDRFGPPAEVARCLERDDPPSPGAGEVRLRVLVANINPADLLVIEGRYGTLPKLPAIPGAECVARVEAVGAGVASPAIGEIVVPMATSCWREIIVTKAAALVKLPPASTSRRRRCSRPTRRRRWRCSRTSWPSSPATG
jgi:NADPH:quinone reductase-like Zn-dependent oxidoreductase